jgi:electron transport complex protein RnfC
VYPNGLPEILARNYGGGLLMRGNEQGVVGNTVVVSIEYAIAMVACLHSGKPLMEKTITFSPGQNGEPQNFRVRIGTSVADVLLKVGVETQPKDKLILNGLMNGYTCFSGEQPITSTTDSVHLQRSSQVFVFQNAACTNCGKCNTVCPVDLEVNLLGRFSEYAIFDKCLALGAENCVECGLCAFVCPAVTHTDPFRQPSSFSTLSRKTIPQNNGQEEKWKNEATESNRFPQSSLPLRDEDYRRLLQFSAGPVACRGDGGLLLRF